MFGDENNPQWKVDAEKQLFVGQYQWEIGKVGLDSPAGWIAFSNRAQGYAFAARFTYFPNAEYPDQGATVECWTVGRGKVANLNYENSQIYLMEAEVLSPFYTFQPGETRACRIEWGVCRCAGQVVELNEAGCVHQPLAVESIQDGCEANRLFRRVRCRSIATGLERSAWKIPGYDIHWRSQPAGNGRAGKHLSSARADCQPGITGSSGCGWLAAHFDQLPTLGDDVETRQIALLRPDQIVQEIERCPLVYLPVGPLEWHGPHLPLGVDALNAEKVAQLSAQKTGGLVLPTFYWGTERERSPEMLKWLGFEGDEWIVGMDFPANALPSMYAAEEVFALLIREQLRSGSPNGFSHHRGHHGTRC